MRKEIEKRLKVKKKINKSKNYLFEKVNKTDKLLAGLTKKKRERTEVNKIRNERGEVKTDTIEIQKYF